MHGPGTEDETFIGNRYNIKPAYGFVLENNGTRMERVGGDTWAARERPAYGNSKLVFNTGHRIA